jgi:hypothetical protein
VSQRVEDILTGGEKLENEKGGEKAKVGQTKLDALRQHGDADTTVHAAYVQNEGVGLWG